MGKCVIVKEHHFGEPCPKVDYLVFCQERAECEGCALAEKKEEETAIHKFCAAYAKEVQKG